MQSNKICDYCKKDGNPDKWSDCLFCHADEVEFDGIDAIPVERVARWIMRFAGYVPCDCMYPDEMQEKWRKGECKNGCRIDMTDADVFQCWLHAIKEGWLDE